VDRLDINANTYTSQDLKSALAKFKEGTEMENSKDELVCDSLSS
jgi:nucleotide exchange factor SIL1